LAQNLEKVIRSFPEDVVERGVNRNWNQHLFLLKRLSPYLSSLPERAAICDIGAGAAVVPLALANLGFTLTLVDKWSEYEDAFNNQMGTRDDFFSRFRQFGVSYCNCDFLQDRIPLQDGSQDMVTAFSVLEHLPKPRVLLDEMWRLLKPGGLVAILVPNTANLQNRLRLLLGGSPHPHNWKDFYGSQFFGHYRELTRKELSEIFRHEGYEILLLCTSNASQTNAKKAGGRWGRHWRPDSIEQLVRGLYLLAVALYPNLRYDLLLVARKPA